MVPTSLRQKSGIFLPFHFTVSFCASIMLTTLRTGRYTNFKVLRH